MRFKSNTTVSCVVEAENHFLVVEECPNGATVFNQPAGHLEANESLLSAARRELYEETGVIALPQWLIGIYQMPGSGDIAQYLRFCFAIQLPQRCALQPKDPDIKAAHWFTREQLATKHLRSNAVLRCVDDYYKAPRTPLSVLNYQSIA